MSTRNDAIHDTVIAMMNEIGKLRGDYGMAIDSMPEKLQQVRQLLRELDYELSERKKRQNIDAYYTDRANSGQSPLEARR